MKSVIFIYIFIALFISNFLIAQNTDEQAIKFEFQKYLTSLVGISETQSTEGIYNSFFTKDFESQVSYLTVSGVSKIEKNEKQNPYLEQFFKTPDLKVDLTERETEVIVKGRNGVLFFDGEFTVTQNTGDLILRGKVFLILNYRNTDDSWKISHIFGSIVNLEEKKGDCNCKIFDAETGEYIVKTSLPEGETYTSVNNEVKIKNGEIVFNEKTYQWDGSTVSLEGTEIGTAGDNKTAIRVVSQNYYEEKCFTMKVTN